MGKVWPDRRQRVRRARPSPASADRWDTDTDTLLSCSRQDKENEFRSWMVEERKINPETVKKDKEKKEWSVYVEDFNTGESELA